LVGDSKFHIIPLKKWNIHETKLQILWEADHRIVTKYLNEAGKNHYTYQLKSCKGLQVVLKCIVATVALLQTSEGNRVDNIIRQRVRVGAKSVGISAAVEVYLVSQRTLKSLSIARLLTYQGSPDACRAARDCITLSLLSWVLEAVGWRRSVLDLIWLLLKEP